MTHSLSQRPLALKFKRACDLIGAGTLLFLLLPLLIVLYLTILLLDGRPVFFTQTRIGLRGRPFEIWKFRTMGQGAERDFEAHRAYLQAWIRGEAARQLGGQEQKAVYKLSHDPRITRLGHFLRRWSLDELPQLWNVLRGEMSLIGPRPAVPYEVAEYQTEQLERLAVKPGITGLWQVSGRNENTFAESIEMDLRYNREWSIGLELKILLLTLPAAIRYKGR